MSTDTNRERSYLKWLLDLAMAITFLLLLNTHVLGGLLFHEIAGSAIGLVFALHVFLNWRWVVNVTRRISDPQLPGKTRFGYRLNWLLLLFMAFILASGVLVSRVVYPNFHVPNKGWIEAAHTTVSFVIMAVVAIHVGLHWNWIGGVSKRIFGVAPGGGRLRTVAAMLAVVGVLLAIGIPVYRSQYSSAPPMAEGVANGQGQAPDKANRMNPRRDDMPRGEWQRDDRRPDGRREGRMRRGRFFGPWRILMANLIIMALVAWATVSVEKWMVRRLAQVRQFRLKKRGWRATSK